MPLESLQNGRYRILRPLGSGSMGEVYLVDDIRINRQVAIKLQDVAHFLYQATGNLPSDHTYPGIGEVITSSPNQVTSQGIQPSGSCS